MATAAMIGWTIVGATLAVTDLGRQVWFKRDSPCMVKALVRESVDRWRWKLVEAQFRALRVAEGRGPVWEPVARLLKTGRWGTAHCRGAEEVITISGGERAALKSALVGGQWPQDRLHRAGLVDHPNCVLCGASGVEVRGTLSHRCLQCEVVEARTGQKRPHWITEEWKDVLESRRTDTGTEVEGVNRTGMLGGEAAG